MKNTKEMVSALDKILEKSLNTLKSSKEQIFNIVDETREECERIEKELVRLKKEVEIIILDVDNLNRLERDARFKLLQVSKNFKKYSEEDIRETYEKATKYQLEITLKREKEVQLRNQRDDMERRLKNLLKTLEKAENLGTQVELVMGYLKGDMKEYTDYIKDIKQRQFLGIQVIKAQEEERKRLARDIHDGPAQNLANALIKAEICNKVIKKDTDSAKEELNDLKTMIKSILKELRQIIFDLRPMSLDDLGLIPAIKRFVQEVQKNSKTTLRLVIMGETHRIPQDFHSILFRVIQEGVNNGVKHSFSEYIDVQLEGTFDYINIKIKDDGKGFDVEEKVENSNSERGLGLISMKERVELIRGEFNIQSAEGKGTSINIKIPLKEKGEVNGENKNFNS